MKNKLAEMTALVDARLDEYLREKNNPQKSIYEAMRYSVFAGGKRLRPILMLSVCEMCGGDKDAVMPFACAMEMIHTYSLIHDDLPAMDNDSLRRGIPASHIKFGEAMAILAGDALLNRAFEIASDYDGTDSARILKALNILARSSGAEGMIGGQVVDMESEGRDITAEELKYLHLNKTGAIIKSACVIGALMADASEKELSAAEAFAENLGIAFQIQDDILDAAGNEKTLGKTTGSDAEAGKSTYVKLFGIGGSRDMAAQYSENAKRALDIFGNRADFLINLTDSLTNRNK